MDINPVPIIPVIMAGGSGTRLWPLSRTAFPKQFLSLGYDKTMLQQTVARLDGLSKLSGLNDAAPIIITNEDHRFLVAEQLRQMNRDASILLEPVGRNTAPAIALAAFQAMKGFDSVDSRLRGNDGEKSGNDDHKWWCNPEFPGWRRGASPPNCEKTGFGMDLANG